MSTRVAENCPACTTATTPIDKSIPLELNYHTVPAKFWRYLCQCGNVWANAAQRAHNEVELKRARANAQSLWI